MESSPNMTIYKAIADFVQEPDFSSNTTEFMVNVYKEFNEEEENKLEYTQIFTDYVKILDEIIESKISADYD